MPGCRGRRRLSLALLVAALALVAGCTSDPPNGVGLDQVVTDIDLVLEPLALEDIPYFQTLPIQDDSVPLESQQVLYFGEQDGTASYVLLNFDFSDVYTEEHPESVWNLESIKSVKLLFIVAENYATNDSLNAVPKVYDLVRLEEPFEPADYPGPQPADLGSSLLSDVALSDGRDVSLTMQEGNLLSWISAGSTEGFILKDGVGEDAQGQPVYSEPGLVGLASQEILYPSQFPTETDVEDPRIRIFVEFEDELGLDGVYILPTADISTFHEIEDVPANLADGFTLRTCLRNYPVLRFDFSDLPANAYVNRAVLSVVNDTTTSYGPLEAIVVSEVDMDILPAPGDSISLTDLATGVYTISGMVNLDPFNNDVMEFNVTTAVHRIVNQVYEGERGFLLAAGEDMFPGYDISALDPDFYFTRFNFFGTSAADSLRPRLKLSYSVVEDLGGGED